MLLEVSYGRPAASEGRPYEVSGFWRIGVFRVFRV